MYIKRNNQIEQFGYGMNKVMQALCLMVEYIFENSKYKDEYEVTASYIEENPDGHIELHFLVIKKGEEPMPHFVPKEDRYWSEVTFDPNQFVPVNDPVDAALHSIRTTHYIGSHKDRYYETEVDQILDIAESIFDHLTISL